VNRREFGGLALGIAKFSTGAPCWFTPLFETNDARYAWLNKVQGIARGTAAGKIVTFELAAMR